mmetsp:Transcript_470/g.1326  ORF Transcript_470/g.1326 Transcript_470/m.1326 type:complete len:305 (+) Transcript_470:190-1104(+)
MPPDLLKWRRVPPRLSHSDRLRSLTTFPPFPSSTTRSMPSPRSARSLCATVITVRPLSSIERRRVTASSVAWSSAEENSSRSTTAGSASNNLAMATRCLSPPESVTPPSPTCVSSPSGSERINGPSSTASIAATTFVRSSAAWNASISSDPSPLLAPNATLCAIVPASRVISWGTVPTNLPLSCRGSSSRTSIPPTSTEPSCTSYRRETSRSRVDFPQPDAPIRPTRSPARMLRSKSRSPPPTPPSLSPPPSLSSTPSSPCSPSTKRLAGLREAMEFLSLSTALSVALAIAASSSSSSSSILAA